MYDKKDLIFEIREIVIRLQGMFWDEILGKLLYLLTLYHTESSAKSGYPLRRDFPRSNK